MKRWIMLPTLTVWGAALLATSGCAVPARPVVPTADRTPDRIAEQATERKTERMERRRPALPSTAQSGRNPARNAVATARSTSAGDAVDPTQTSDDPTYGYTRENPVRLGSEHSDRQVASSYVYLRQLRDKNRKPFKVVRVGSMGANPDMHIIDRYKLTDSEGNDFTIYLDMYHPENNPLDCKAPTGMFMAQ